MTSAKLFLNLFTNNTMCLLQGNIAEWKKQVGDEIGPGDVLCGIETDKATMDYEMQEEGFVAKILYPAGAKDIPLGAPLAIIVEDEEDVAAFADYVPGQEDAGASEPAAEVKEEPV